jgi:alanine racemase
MKNSKSLKTWVEVDSLAIAHNFRTFRGLISKKCRLMAVVKSNSYGHDIIQYSKEAQKLGADFIGVDDIEEGLLLRKNGIKIPILVFGYVPVGLIPDAIKHTISLTVSNFEMLQQLSKLKAPSMQIHVKVDTGLGRQGFLSSQLPRVIEKLKNSPHVKVQGLYSHFAGIESKKFNAYSEKQAEELKRWDDALNQAGIFPIVHMSSTAGILANPKFHFDMVRLGIGGYGLWPSEETQEKLEDKIKLKSALTWKTVIAEIKNLPKGNKIGYDLTESLKKDSVVGVCPVGYWHGYPRGLSSKGHILVRGKRAKVLGRVSMDMIVVDLSGIKGAKRGDEVILIGRSGKDEISAGELAEKAGTINYEIVTRINPQIPRIYR